jgi:Flp pilus assembly protein TadG
VSRLRRRSHRGQALVEFALILPIFILMLVGIFDMGRAVYDYNVISNAARQAMRLAIVDQNTTAITNEAVQHSIGIATASNVTVQFIDTANATTYSQCSAAPNGCQLGWQAVVTVTYDYTAATPVIGNLVGTIGMASTSKQAIEYVYTSP